MAENCDKCGRFTSARIEAYTPSNYGGSVVTRRWCSRCRSKMLKIWAKELETMPEEKRKHFEMVAAHNLNDPHLGRGSIIYT